MNEIKAEAPKDDVVVAAAPQDVKLQKVLVVFADGRQGVFVGPALLSTLEMANPPRLVKVDFSEPFILQAETPQA
jgi:hypothetical protein